MKIRHVVIALIFLFLTAAFTWSQGTAGKETLSLQMTHLVLQLALVLFAVRGGGALAKKLKLPSVIGELLAGVVIGPFALGSLPLPGFAQGIFPVAEGFAISPVLYGFSSVAAIILLFSSGLETDIDMLLRYSVAGGIVGMGGVIASFGLGAGAGALLLGVPFFSPGALFLGIMSTATSVGITARILSDRKKMDSPEGTVILAAAVFDDVLGIVALAIVMGIVAVMTGHQEGGLSTWGITVIALKAFGIWLGFTALGLIFGKRIAKLLKKAGGEASFPVMALGLAFLLAGFFEMQGLAMIIGAYIVGISLSKTDIAYVIQDKTKPLYNFFVPIFFAIMGMLVDVRQLLNPAVLGFGAIYTLMAIAAKVAGCGIPSLFLGFNARGSMRIGIGMVPRGEVALIIAGIGLSAGILPPTVFGVSILMIMATTIIAPPLFNQVISHGGEGTRLPVKGSRTETLKVDLPSKEIAELVSSTLLRDLEREGFFVQLMSIRDEISHIRKGDISISLITEKDSITLETAPEDMPFLRALVHENFVKLDANFDKLKENYDTKQFRTELHPETGRVDAAFGKMLDLKCLTASLAGNTREEVIKELVEMLAASGKTTNTEKLLADVLERERYMSTGMEHGIALPHARTSGVKRQALAIGIHKAGIDFGTIDGTPGRIIALIASPSDDEAPHMQLLASLGTVLGDDNVRRKLIDATTSQEVFKALTKS